jgi:hypothetical protein
VREFLVESVLPFVSVCTLVAGITVVTFDVPNAPPPAASSTSEVTFTPAAIPDKASQPMTTTEPVTTTLPLATEDPRRERINQVLARAVRNLGEDPAAPTSAVGSLGSPAPQANPKVFGVVSKLGEAMKLAREARDDKDLAKAEELMRSVRQEMDAVCDKAGGGGPLCQSAEQIRSLGY